MFSQKTLQFVRLSSHSILHNPQFVPCSLSTPVSRLMKITAGFSQLAQQVGLNSNLSQWSCSLCAMCSVGRACRVRRPQWTRCSRWWCWTALSDSRPLWTAGSRPLIPGLSWWCCPTPSWAPCCSEERCRLPWTGTLSDEVWSRPCPPAVWIHESVWPRRRENYYFSNQAANMSTF